MVNKKSSKTKNNQNTQPKNPFRSTLEEDSIFQPILDDSSSETFEILKKLMDDEDIELKTEIDKPYKLSTLKLLSDLLETENMQHSSQVINKYIKILMKYFISFNRKSRAEIIEALKQLSYEENVSNDPNIQIQ